MTERITAHNKSICKSRAGQCNISYVQASAVVWARRSMFSFSSYLQQHIFKRAFVPGWTINEFPAFANTRTLAAILDDTLQREK